MFASYSTFIQANCGPFAYPLFIFPLCSRDMFVFEPSRDKGAAFGLTKHLGELSVFQCEICSLSHSSNPETSQVAYDTQVFQNIFRDTSARHPMRRKRPVFHALSSIPDNRKKTVSRFYETHDPVSYPEKCPETERFRKARQNGRFLRDFDSCASPSLSSIFFHRFFNPGTIFECTNGVVGNRTSDQIAHLKREN